MKRLVLLLASASLAACGGEPADPQANQVQVEEPPAEEAPGNAAPAPEETDNSSSPTAPSAAAIPAAFRGTWAESEALCANRSHPSRLAISDRSVRFYESVLEVARVEEIGPREINIVGTATGEGTTRPAEYHYSLDAAGDTLTDEAGGGTVRTRCAS